MNTTGFLVTYSDLTGTIVDAASAQLAFDGLFTTSFAVAGTVDTPTLKIDMLEDRDVQGVTVFVPAGTSSPGLNASMQAADSTRLV